MSRWFVKAAAQKALSFLPAAHACNYLLQKHITGSIALDHATLKSKIDYARRYVQLWEAINGTSLEGVNAFELGTGWYPVLPIVLYLCGANKVWTIDKVSLLRRENVIKTLQLLRELIEGMELRKDLPWIHEDRVKTLLSLSHIAETLGVSDLLARLNIEALVQDATHTTIESGSINLLLSNSVLQEIPQHTLVAIFGELRRIASSDSTMIHYINMVEPLVAYDSRLTAYYFLQFHEATWRYINNPIHFHNRLRMPDYRVVHESSEFRIVSEENESGSESDLDAVSLASPFTQYSRADLRILRTWIVSQIQH